MPHAFLVFSTIFSVCIVTNSHRLVCIMILPNSNVELTKVHYYDVNESGRTLQISTIFNERPRKTLRNNTVIKKNIFGHKWVLKINESNDNLKKSKVRLIVYILMFLCIIIAVTFGIILSIDSDIFKSIKTSDEIQKKAPNNDYTQHRLNFTFLNVDTHKNLIENTSEIPTDINNIKMPSWDPHSFCNKCNKTEEVCLNIIEGRNPECIKIADKKDPTGCGGLCKINEEYCKLLDAKDELYQCRRLVNTLNCSNEDFNCGNRCISKKLRCDGMIHCTNQSDEKNCECDLKTHFQCGNATSCLEPSKRCDGKVDCWDNSDEINCTSSCPFNELPCLNGICIKKERYCDGIINCTDNSDEPFGCELTK